MSSLVQIRRADAATPSGGAAPSGGVALDQKEAQLLARLAELPSLLIAVSGGADSAYLAWAAHRALGQRALSVTAISPSYSAYDREQLQAFLLESGVRHEFVETHEMENPEYRANAGDRCYHCKDELFRVLDALAAQRGFAAVAYGVNADDTSDFRPGHRAAAEHRVLAPLLEAGMSKAEIRELSRRAGLGTWDRPASACLSSRLPYGTEVTAERLLLIEKSEAALRDLGFRQFRVRLHDTLARVEIAQDELPRALNPEMAGQISARLKAAGFLYVALDLEGYRQGSLNAALGLAKGAGQA
ncbi:MAG TPA: ATP-dependent sacrificial sulfur transferase LarE [Dongiaceae bacterium]|nr:ATP-dependent sacrificial sulfur transferase LarE [Dongiaceae bacterium]